VTSTFEFSAQFGGRDAADAALPHFKALKAAALTCSLRDFPFNSLAFILRVDGNINSYGLSGPGNIDCDGDNYVSVDIGVSRADYTDGSTQLVGPITTALRQSVELLKQSQDVRLRDVDFDQLEQALSDLCESYEAIIDT